MSEDCADGFSRAFSFFVPALVISRMATEHPRSGDEPVPDESMSMLGRLRRLRHGARIWPYGGNGVENLDPDQRHGGLRSRPFSGREDVPITHHNGIARFANI